MSFQSRNRLTSRPDHFVTPSAPRPSLRQRIAFTLALWRQRAEARRSLALMDARSLRDAGISPVAESRERLRQRMRHHDLSGGGGNVEQGAIDIEKECRCPVQIRRCHAASCACDQLGADGVLS